MIRAYSKKDKSEVVNLLKGNTPQFFDPSEESEFVEYLDERIESYYVVEEDGKIVGAGGINIFPEKGEARISWDMIHPDYQGKGIGRQLTLYRINELKKNATVRVVYVRTTQLVYPFYEKIGFTLEKTEKDFWAKGFDLYQMKMVLKEK